MQVTVTGDERVAFAENFAFEAPAAAPPALQRALERTARGLPRAAGGALRAVEVRVAAYPPVGPAMDESYTLELNATRGVLAAPQLAGALRGLATLGQLATPRGTRGRVSIADQPRFAHRGIMIDSSRHFLPSSQFRT